MKRLLTGKGDAVIPATFCQSPLQFFHGNVGFHVDDRFLLLKVNDNVAHTFRLAEGLLHMRSAAAAAHAVDLIGVFHGYLTGFGLSKFPDDIGPCHGKLGLQLIHMDVFA